MRLLAALIVPVLASALPALAQQAGEDTGCAPCRECLPGAPLGDGSTTGPARGTLIAIGGGRLTDDMIEAFIEGAGGPGSPIVYIPTAHAGDLSGQEDDAYGVVRILKARGCTDVTVVHTRDRDLADTEAFAGPIAHARGVWFSGGRQWRFVDSYMGTAACDAFHGVLERGGVIAGSSAGATIQASYLVRGAREGNQIMMAEGYEQGFAFIRNAAIDQHLFARGRAFDLVPVLERHPHLLGIGIDESAAIVVRGRHMRVIGESDVAVYTADALDGERPFLRLEPGDEYDLVEREVIENGLD